MVSVSIAGQPGLCGIAGVSKKICSDKETKTRRRDNDEIEKGKVIPVVKENSHLFL